VQPVGISSSSVEVIDLVRCSSYTCHLIKTGPPPPSAPYPPPTTHPPKKNSHPHPSVSPLTPLSPPF
jgi:hypothetical protein